MEAEVKALCAKAREILVEESNVQRVDSPVTVRILTVRLQYNNIIVANHEKPCLIPM